MIARGQRVPDVNGFATASVLRALRGVEEPLIAPTRRRALDFLASCESPSVPGAYAFWPAGARPAWAARVPPDVDDTALMSAELLRHGRVGRDSVMRTLCTTMLPCRVRPGECEALPRWIVAGCFGVWIAPSPHKRRMPIVDACANANAAALMALVDATHLPGYAEASDAIARALDWAGDDRLRLASITPFYPSRASLAEALAHAVECGAIALEPSARRAHAIALDAGDADAGCCSSAYGDVVWQCPALEVARALAGEHASQLGRSSCRSSDMQTSAGRSPSSKADSITHSAAAPSGSSLPAVQSASPQTAQSISTWNSPAA